jgi:AcrR family transcriptional regulator
MPKKVDHDQYRRELVSGCVELFAASGYSALTIRAIARGLGVSTGTLYHYFPNKQAIFMAVVESITELDSFASEGLLELDPNDRLDAVLRYVDENRARFAQHLMVLTEVIRVEDEDGPVLRVVRAATQDYIAGVTAILELPNLQAGRLVLSMINGVLFHEMPEGPGVRVRFADLAQGIRGMLIGLAT